METHSCISGNQLAQLALNWRSKWRSTGAPNGAQLALQTLNYVPNCHSCISGNKLRGGNRQTVTQNNMQKTHGRRTPGQEPRKHLRLWCWLKCVSTMRATLRDPSRKYPKQKNKKLFFPPLWYGHDPSGPGPRPPLLLWYGQAQSIANRANWC